MRRGMADGRRARWHHVCASQSQICLQHPPPLVSPTHSQMADCAGPSSSTTVVLRKRKRATSPLVLRLSSSPAPTSHSESEYDPQYSPVSPVVSITLDAGPSERSIARKKKYACDFEGCHKAYSKPARLAEHQRSHTGDVCLSSILFALIFMLAAEAFRLQNLQQIIPARKPSTGALTLASARVGQAVHLRGGRVRQTLLDDPTSPCARKSAQGREALQGTSDISTDCCNGSHNCVYSATNHLAMRPSPSSINYGSISARRTRPRGRSPSAASTQGAPSPSPPTRSCAPIRRRTMVSPSPSPLSPTD